MARPLTMSRLVAVNAVVAGLEIAACVAFTFIPPLLLKSGFSESSMSIILGIAPFLALFTVPALGKWSDTCNSRLGRRRPFIVLMSVILVLSLLLLFVGQTMSGEGGPVVRMLLLGLGVVLLDYSSQAAINPCEALMSDMMAEANSDMLKLGGEEAGFTVYSGMLSLGACLGYLLTAIDWTTVGLTANLGLSAGNREQTALVLVLVLYVICFIITMMSAWEKPYSPSGYLQYSETVSDPGYESEEERLPTAALLKSPPRSKLRPAFSLKKCSAARLVVTLMKLTKNVLCLPLSYLYTVLGAPPVLRTLFYADLFSWIGIMAHGMFYTDFVAQAVYGGQPGAPPGSVYDILFDEGVRMGSWGLLLHSITAGVYAVFIQEHVTNAIGLRRSYQLGLAVFSISMAASVLLSTSLTCLNLAAAASGLGYAVITTIPNTLITMYHEEPDLYYGSHARAGVGEDIAILDSGYFLSQIALSLVMGKLVELTGLTHYYIIVACLAGILATILADKVVYSQQDLTRTKMVYSQ